MSATVRTPPPTVNGMKHTSAVRRTTSRMMSRSSWLAVISRKHSSSAPAASYATAASTGSPASRKLTKLTPLTTRPSLTSRQGMTRTLSTRSPLHPGVTDQPQRLTGIEPSIIECAARNGARQLFCPRLQQLADVIHRGKAAGRDDRDSNRIGQRNGGVEVEALEKAVAGNIRMNDCGNAGILESQRNFKRRQIGSLGPTLHGDTAVARIQSDGNAVRPVACGLFDEVRVFHGCCPDNDTIDALFEPRRDRRPVANSASKLHRQWHAFEDPLDHPRVDRATGECAIQIDHMQIFKPFGLEPRGLGGSVTVEYGCSPHVALLQAHAHAVL